MAYIGNSPQSQGFTPAIDYFSGNGVTVTFTLSRPVASVAQVIIAIDNVVQNSSTAYSISGNSITFTSAPLSGTNNIWVQYTSLVTQYNAISQDPSVIGDITATGGFLAVGDFGNTYTDGTIVDYVTGMARITTGPADGLTIYNGGTSARNALFGSDASGNFGVGTTSPAVKLDVSGQRIRVNYATDPGIELAASSIVKGYVFYDSTNNVVTIRHASSTGINLASNGNIGIGVNAPDNKLQVAGGFLQTSAWAVVGAHNGGGNYPTPTDVGVAFAWNFTSGGREVTMMNNDTGGSGVRFVQRTGTSTSSYIGSGSSSGAWFQGNNSSSWSTVSDARIKQNIRPINSALDKIADLQPCHFEYIDKAGKVKTGFIAQEFETVFPGHIIEQEFIPEEYKDFIPEGDKLKGIDADLVPYLVKAIQEQQAIIEDLKARIETLEAK